MKKLNLSILLALIIIGGSAYFFLYTKNNFIPPADIAPAPIASDGKTPGASLETLEKEFTFYAAVPKELDNFFRDNKSTKNATLIFAHGNDTRAIKADSFSYSSGQATIKAILPRDIVHKYDKILIRWIDTSLKSGAAAESRPANIVDAMNSNSPRRLFVFSLYDFKPTWCAPENTITSLPVEIKITEAAKLRLNPRGRYVLALAYLSRSTVGETPAITIVSHLEVSGSELLTGKITRELKIPQGSPNLTDEKHLLALWFSACEKSASLTACAAQLAHNPLAKTFVLVSKEYNSTISLCKKEPQKKLLVPVDSELVNIVPREMANF